LLSGGLRLVCFLGSSGFIKYAKETNSQRTQDRQMLYWLSLSVQLIAGPVLWYAVFDDNAKR
jgi:hypothetical protein